MAWVQLFPTGNTLISQSVGQIQANWLFIQNNINTDHSFNTGAPSEGHHKFMHLPTQGADQAVILTGVVYQKANTSGNPMLYYRTTQSGINQIATGAYGTIAIAGAGTWMLHDFVGKPKMMAIITATEWASTHNRRAVGFVTWNGAVCRVDNILTTPNLNFFTNNINSVVSAQVLAPSNIVYNIIKLEV